VLGRRAAAPSQAHTGEEAAAGEGPVCGVPDPPDCASRSPPRAHQTTTATPRCCLASPRRQRPVGASYVLAFASCGETMLFLPSDSQHRQNALPRCGWVNVGARLCDAKHCARLRAPLAGLRLCLKRLRLWLWQNNGFFGEAIL
jgi:hypothetical protein